MRFQMLGSARVWDGEAWRPVRAPQQRVVLAVLLIEAGRIVTVDRLIDEVWADRPPRWAASTVQGYVMRLRRQLGRHIDDALATHRRGYLLTVHDGDYDVAEFDRLVVSGEQALARGNPGSALDELAAALDLWHGSALADVPPSRTVLIEAARLDQRRLAAQELRFSALLDLGRHGQVADDLPALVGAHPLREHLHELLMRALYLCGRRGEALRAYLHARQVIVAESGQEPGPRLQDLHQAILRDDPLLAAPSHRPSDSAALAGHRAPAQLPPDVTAFTGRSAQLKQLDGLLSAGGERPVMVISTVTGGVGVGKTALAVHWAHRVRDRFPDGQLYVNLRGHATGSPARPLETLARFLPSLGVPADEVPSDEETAAALYRSVLADRRVLVVLDNARDPDQVRPLLPGGEGCWALVTSRNRLGGLEARDGALPLLVDVFTPAESGALLGRLLGEERVAAEPGALAELADLCGHLPLALRIAAAHLGADEQASLAAFNARLRDNQLAELGMAGDPQTAVAAAFDLSYRALREPCRRLFRLLGLVPGHDIADEGAAALAGLAPTRTTDLLRRLADAHLIDRRSPGRYTMHDLLRLYAAQRAETTDSAADRRAAQERLYEHYLYAAGAAAAKLVPQIVRLPLPSTAPDGLPIEFADSVQALAWLDGERSNLVAAVHRAAADGLHQAAARLADALRGYLYLGMHTVDWRSVADAALAAAQFAGDTQATAAAHLSLGTLHWIQNLHPQAAEHFTAVVDLARRSRWHMGESAGLSGLGGVHSQLGNLELAADCYWRALAVDRRCGWVAGEAARLGSLGILYHVMGRLADANRYQRRALALFRRSGSPIGEAKALAAIGQDCHALGRFADALAVATEALALHRDGGHRAAEADTLRTLADVHRDAGRHDEASECVAAALTIALEIEDRRIEADALATQAGVHLLFGRRDLAEQGYRQALTIGRDIADPYAEAEALIGLATVEHRAGDLAGAATHLGEAVGIARERGYRMIEGIAGTALAAVDLDRGRPDAADQARGALAVHLQTGHRLGEARTHLLLGEIAERVGQITEADAHRRRAKVLFRRIGAPVDASGC